MICVELRGMIGEAVNEAAMSGAVDLPEALTRRERLELAWALVWPCALFDLVYSVILTQLRLSESQRQNWEEAIGIVWFFLFSTWVVRRTVRLEFTGFHRCFETMRCKGRGR